MKSLFSRSLAAAAVGAFALTLGVCGGSTSEDSSGGAGNKLTELTVGASPVPHIKIPKCLEDSGEVKRVGLKLNVKNSSSYVLPNEALAGDDTDTSRYRTVPCLESQSKSHGCKFTAGEGIHLEPLAVFPRKVKSFKEIKDGATISIISGPANRGRSLALLAVNNLLKLEGTGASVLQIKDDPKASPHGLKFHEVDGPSLVTSPPDVGLSVINGNFYQSVGLKPSEALAIELPKDNPVVNILVWCTGERSKLETIKKLEDLLHSDVTKKYIGQTWPDKEVIPLF